MTPAKVEMSASHVTQIPRGGDYFNEDEDENGGARKTNVFVKNKWEGEDEDETILDSWDQDDEDENQPQQPQQLPSSEKASKKNLKKLNEKLLEKERLAQKAVDENVGKDVKDMTPEEKLAEKLRRQKCQEESDLSLAKEVFGVGQFLESKEEYDKLRDDVLKIVQDSVKNANYFAFADDLINALCLHMSSIDIKKIHTKIGNLQIEKSKIEKGDKGKKSKGKAKIRVERDGDYSEFSAYGAEEFDDFI